MVVAACEVKILSSLTGFDLYYLALTFSEIGRWALGVGGLKFRKDHFGESPKPARGSPIRHCCQWTWGVISAFAAARKP